MRDNQTSQVEFRGEGSEYFKIWIVNIFLTICTLGIYSAWAKVRTAKYFTNHTFLDDRSLSFDADPLKILIARLFVALILILLYIINEIFPLAGVVVSILMTAFILPLMFIASLTFYLRNTKYRGVRFNFKGTYRQAFAVYTLPWIGFFLWGYGLWYLADSGNAELMWVCGILGVLIYPVVFFYQTSFTVKNIWFGEQGFEFNGTLSASYLKLIFPSVLLIVSFIFVGSDVGGLMFLGSIMIFLIAIFSWLYMYVQVRNLTYNSLVFADMSAESNMTFFRYAWVHFTNMLLNLLSLGLYKPFAKIRIAKYKAASTRFLLTDRIDQIEQIHKEKRSAFGEEAADSIFDVDIIF